MTSMPRWRSFDILAHRETIHRRIAKVQFQRDGSIFVFLPGFATTSGILCRAVAHAGIQPDHQISLKEHGKVTNHLVKYAHHPDGEAHFSQDGKVKTEIRRKSVPLDKHHGHLFSLQFQNIESFPVVDNPKSHVFTVDITEDVHCMKIVGWRYPLSMIKRPPNVSKGARMIGMQLGDGYKTGFFVLPPSGLPFDDVVLFLSVEATPLLSPDKAPQLIVLGGFDPGEIAMDNSQDTEFLVAAYPCSDPEALAEAIGSVDLKDNSGKQTP